MENNNIWQDAILKIIGPPNRVYRKNISNKTAIIRIQKDTHSSKISIIELILSIEICSLNKVI